MIFGATLVSILLLMYILLHDQSCLNYAPVDEVVLRKENKRLRNNTIAAIMILISQVVIQIAYVYS